MQTICWYCYYFAIQSGTSGHCRRYAPRSIDFQSIPGSISSAGDRVFPYIGDSRIEWCGDFKQAGGTVAAPPA